MLTILTQKPPIIIAHRGASGYRPEHTLAAYELAIDMEADFIEPDLVITKDGILIARHENEISATTDVAIRPEFANRKTIKVVDGEAKNGWFTEDFTLAEIKTLRAKERIPQLRPQNTAYDGLWEIPTLQEVIDLVKHKSVETGRTIGIYPETKHPTYFQSIGLPLEETLVVNLQANGYEGSNAPIFIQCFEVSNLQELSIKTDLPLVQLLNVSGKPYDFVVSGDERTYVDLATAEGLREISRYAQAIGIHKNLLLPKDSEGKLLSPTSLISNAHKANLLVHVWTLRNEDFFLPPDLQGNPQGEYELFFNLGIDGVFSDNPDTAISVRVNKK
ncbi:glycerophosphodiester phosphodiesterase [Fischerella sp. PCC 9605]|uniref:glycerophosphodiester phosphodiesterase n=1 Tax=Fischerella sp. PCC 9605 TaxID=1173024 RepID=UPI00047A7931|nr:glycerophosphodiester phosphodiesterase [Fischerella sp. PCC 9605]